MLRHLASILLVLLTFGCTMQAALIENFDNIATLPASGWSLVNNSSPAGTTGWFQGNDLVFSAMVPPANSYIAANYDNATYGGTISNWLISPVWNWSNGNTITFWTRTEDSTLFADRLEVRLSLNGSSTDVGSTTTSVGDFTTLLLTINPTLAPSGYPNAWTQFTTSISGLGSATLGRAALRYYVPGTNVNGDYIGVDSFVITPEPASWLSLGAGLAGLALWRRRKTAAKHVLGLVALAAIVALPSVAQDQAKQADAKAAAVKPAAKTAPGSGGMIVVKDPATGQLRAPDADEYKALMGAAKTRSSAAPAAGKESMERLDPSAVESAATPGPVRMPNGRLMMKLDESFMTYSVATRNPDGTISMDCVKGGEAARKQVQKSDRKEAADVK